MSLGPLLFKYRGWIPVPAILYALLAARPGGWTMIAGALAMGLGETLRLWSAAHVGPTVRTGSPLGHQLITRGPYAHTRHPIYWGNFLLAVGFALLSGAGFPWFPFVVAGLFTPLYVRHARREEAVLAEAFPEAHARYTAAVPATRWRLIPAQVPEAGTPERTSWVRALRVDALTLNAIFWLLVVLAVRGWWSARA